MGVKVLILVRIADSQSAGPSTSCFIGCSSLVMIHWPCKAVGEKASWALNEKLCSVKEARRLRFGVTIFRTFHPL